MRTLLVSALALAACSPAVGRRHAVTTVFAVAPPATSVTSVGPSSPLVVATSPPALPPGCDAATGAGCPPPTIRCPAPSAAPAGSAVTLAPQATGAGLRYYWSVTRAPEARIYRFASAFDPNDSDAIVATAPVVPFTSVIVGEYTVRAEVRDPLGRSAACETTVAMRSHGLRVELSWNTNNTDVDLHAVTSAASAWFTPADCYYANRRPDTALGAEALQRWLDTDDTDGEGPENIRVDSPAADRDYVLGVHFYSSHGQSGATRAIVLVYCGEQQAARFERDLAGDRGVYENDFWRVAAVRFDGRGGCAVRPLGEVVTAGAARAAGTTPAAAVATD